MAQTNLADTLVVKDLLSLARFALFPEDDLNLAALLKGPFGNLTEEALFDLCWDRHPKSLWHVLKASSHQELLHFLHEIQRRSHLSPLAFFQQVLFGFAGYEKLSRVSPPFFVEHVEIFLDVVTSYCQKNTFAHLQGFCAFMDETDIPLSAKNQHAQSAYIRFMTVHAAKGLEAPIVILADANYIGQTIPPILWFEGQESTFWPLWVATSHEQPLKVRKALLVEKEHQLEEYHRLLYVALTRAKEYLFVTGWGGRSPPPESWYAQIEKSLNGTSPLPFLQKVESAPEKTQRGPTEEKIPYGPEAGAEKSVMTSPASVPDLFFKVPELPCPEESAPQKDTFSSTSRDYGIAVHLLLEKLPGYALPAHSDLRQSLLERFAFPQDIEERAWQEALAVLGAPHLQWVWNSPHFGTEIDFRTPTAQRGRIDRIVAHDDHFVLIDFKTDRAPPAAMPARYVEQLTSYRDAASSCLQKPLKACVIWTCTQTLSWLPENEVSAPFSKVL
jgi:ATP-dependent helicase/nuclease subunit A